MTYDNVYDLNIYITKANDISIRYFLFTNTLLKFLISLNLTKGYFLASWPTITLVTEYSSCSKSNSSKQLNWKGWPNFLGLTRYFPLLS